MPLPRPWTGGGGKMRTKPSWIDAELLVELAAISGAARALALSKGLRVKNTMPLFGCW
jgi:hypothetical protein